MPTWFYNRPLEKADPTEALVAEAFNKLEGKWLIRWGYFYERKKQAGEPDLRAGSGGLPELVAQAHGFA